MTFLTKWLVHCLSVGPENGYKNIKTSGVYEENKEIQEMWVSIKINDIYI